LTGLTDGIVRDTVAISEQANTNACTHQCLCLTPARTVLLVLLLASFVLRLGISWRLPSIYHPDEVYMVGEQAYQSIHGYGIVPWEFRNAARPAALAVITPFQVVDHKEYRFVIAGLPMVVLLMGFAAGDVLARAAAASTRVRLPLLLGAWIISMLAVSWGDTYRPLWTRSRNHVFAFEDIGADPDACGVGLVNIGWGETPGYAGLGRHIPIYEMGVSRTQPITTNDQATPILLAANYLLLAPKVDPPPAPYVRWRQYTRPVEYLYRRPGGCTPDPALQLIEPPGPDIPGIK
jgi:hypothetical protein